MDQIRILIADDHPVFRFGLRALLNAMPDTEVVGCEWDRGDAPHP
jgi:DNA-binding NarL/FixJ family response regulator